MSMVSEESTEAHKQTNELRHRNARVLNITVLVVAIVVSFIAGTRSDELYRVVGPVFGVKVAQQDLDTSILKETYRQLVANYDGQLDVAKLSDGAARGMVEAAGDQYTAFMDEEEATEFQKDLSGNLSGIGAEIGVRNGQPTVLRVINDSPALQAGLQKGDVFAAVNDESMDGKTASEVADKVRGDTGTTVRLKMRRSDKTHEYTITRAQVNDPSVRWELVDGVGLMTISRFDSQTGALVRKAAEEFASQKVNGVIIDLRDNSGGYLSAANDVASLWLNDQVVVTEKTNDIIVDTIKSGKNAPLATVKTVLLVNNNSASASEIVAGALQEHGKAQLIGEKTYGKGTVQKMINLSGGRLLKVTAARWYTPQGKNITKEGIAPDQVVSISKDEADSGRDPQMNAARSVLAP